jgi:predicted ATPase
VKRNQGLRNLHSLVPHSRAMSSGKNSLTHIRSIMPISSIHITNFKGVRDEAALPIRPLNFFIGPNSSGKSSCIHALTALSQTVKIPNNTSPLLLDGEYVHVHLGRFIEVVHSKKYTDAISIGISLDQVPVRRFAEKRKVIVEHVNAHAKYHFKCTKRTQEIYLSSAELCVGDRVYDVRRSADKYLITERSSQRRIEADLQSGFLFQDLRLYMASPEEAEGFRGLSFLQTAVQTELRKVSYLGPFRQPPTRRYPTRGSSPTEVGATGEATMTLLANEVVQSHKRRHISQIQTWLKHLGLGNKIDVSRIATSDLFDVTVALGDGTSFPLADLGFGLSQVLPVLTQCSFAQPGAVLLFEQPELHLHTLAAKKLVSVFIDTVREKNARIIAETHSPDMIHQLQGELRSGNLKPEEVGVYRVVRHQGASKISELRIDEDFSIYENWEQGLTRE